MGDRFHRAARDGSTQKGLELLKEATSRDLNRYFCSIASLFCIIEEFCMRKTFSFVKKVLLKLLFKVHLMHLKNTTFIVLKHKTIFIG